MRVLLFLVLVTLVGCGSPVTNEQVLVWVPMRTPLASARLAMEQHGFTCTVLSDEQRKKQDDGLPWYGLTLNTTRQNGESLETATNICYLDCQRGKVRIMFRLADNKSTGFGIR